MSKNFLDAAQHYPLQQSYLYCMMNLNDCLQLDLHGYGSFGGWKMGLPSPLIVAHPQNIFDVFLILFLLRGQEPEVFDCLIAQVHAICNLFYSPLFQEPLPVCINVPPVQRG